MKTNTHKVFIKFYTKDWCPDCINFDHVATLKHCHLTRCCQFFKKSVFVGFLTSQTDF